MVDLTLFASLNVQTISLLEANIIVNLLLGTDKIMLQRYMIVLATIQVLCSFCPKNGIIRNSVVCTLLMTSRLMILPSCSITTAAPPAR